MAEEMVTLVENEKLSSAFASLCRKSNIIFTATLPPKIVQFLWKASRYVHTTIRVMRQSITKNFSVFEQKENLACIFSVLFSDTANY
jgi:hypothetical protein